MRLVAIAAALAGCRPSVIKAIECWLVGDRPAVWQPTRDECLWFGVWWSCETVPSGPEEMECFPRYEPS